MMIIITDKKPFILSKEIPQYKTGVAIIGSVLASSNALLSLYPPLHE